MFPGRKYMPSVGWSLFTGDSKAVTGVSPSDVNKSNLESAALCKIAGLICPECGSQLIRNGICFSCIRCGWGACD